MSTEQETRPNPYARPAQATDPEPPFRVPDNRPKPAGFARRLGGAMMIANGVLFLIELALRPSEGAGTAANAMSSPVFGIGPALLDILLGAILLRGSSSVATLAIVRCALGMTAGAALRAGEGPVIVVYQVVLCGSLIGLLAGEAERLRTAIAGSVMGLCLMLEMVGIAAIATGGNPLAPYLMAMSGDVESEPAQHVEGRAAAYQLSFPNKKWYARKPEAAAKDNAVADRWFVRPDRDAHILVVAEHVPGKPIGIEPYTDAIVNNLKKEASDAVILSRGPWLAYPTHGRVVTARATKGSIKLEWHYALLTAFDRAYYVVGFASQENMPSVEEEMRAIIDSFKIPDAVLHALPPDVDPAPAATVHGTTVLYSLTAPNESWHLRKADAVKAENAVIDRWLIQPELDAHVLVIAEDVAPGMTLPIDAYVKVVLDNARNKSERFQELHREPWARFPSDGVRVRVSLARGGVDLEYEYGLYSRGSHAFQVVGFTSKTGYEAVKDQLASVVDSFQPPP
jgi:hypothetical protein